MASIAQRVATRYIYRDIEDIIEDEESGVMAPLDPGVIPNYMGINLVSVQGMSWTRQPDGQLVNLTIHFIPNPKGHGK